MARKAVVENGSRIQQSILRLLEEWPPKAEPGVEKEHPRRGKTPVRETRGEGPEGGGRLTATRKRQYRRWAAERIAALAPRVRRARDDALARMALRHPLLRELRAGAYVFAYAPTADEPGLSRLWTWLRMRGHRLAFPRWNREDDPEALLVFHETRSPPPAADGPESADAENAASASSEEWERASHGIWEPRADTPAVAAARAAVVLVPGRAFDRNGGRLGRGRGCYDRWLSRLSPSVPTLAPAYDEQIFATLPRERHDHPLSAWITPTRRWPMTETRNGNTVWRKGMD